MKDRGFAIIRPPEIDLLRSLPPICTMLLVAMRSRHGDAKPFACGARDFEDWGLTRSTAARAINNLIDAGLIRIVTESRFTSKRERRVVEIVHRKDGKLQSHQRDTKASHSPATGTRRVATVSPVGHEPSLQSHQRDTPKEPSRASPSKAEDREGSNVTPFSPYQRTHLSDDQRRARIEAGERQEAAARATGMTGGEFLYAAGGPGKAQDLADEFAGGEIGLTALRAKLNGEPPPGPCEEQRSLRLLGVYG